MSTVSQLPDKAGLEQLIYQVRGIQAARVVTDENGTIDEVHVVGLPGRTAKQMVRDIESILYVRGGVRLDHRKVSLVQLDEGGAARQAPRVLLLGVSCEAAHPAPAVTVTLGLREHKARGVCTADRAGCGGLLEQTARATVSAIGELVGPGIELRVEQVALHPFGPLSVCLSHLTMISDVGAENLLGISMVRDDEAAAAARAVLDAVNRPLLRLLAARG